MGEKLISAVELADKIGLNYGTLNIHLSNFTKYSTVGGTHFLYKYNYYFLNDLKEFYEKKMHNRNARNAIKYYKVAYNIGQILKKEFK